MLNRSMAKQSIFVQGSVKTTEAIRSREYSSGLVNGEKHGINGTAFISEALWDENRVKAESHANFDEPFRSYWKGYFDGMKKKQN